MQTDSSSFSFQQSIILPLLHPLLFFLLIYLISSVDEESCLEYWLSNGFPQMTSAIQPMISTFTNAILGVGIAVGRKREHREYSLLMNEKVTLLIRCFWYFFP